MNMQLTKTLEGRGARLVAHFAAKSPSVFKTHDAAQLLGVSRRTATDLLWRLVERGWLTRHRSGVFEVAPLWATAETPYRADRFAAVASWIRGDYYIGFRSAMEYHGWLTHPVRNQVWVAVPSARRSPRTSVDKIVWVVVRPNRFAWGVARPWSSSQQIKVSDPERTILDCLHLPRHAGGITEVAGALRMAWASLKKERLLDYVARYGLGSVRQRLGFLIEALDLDGATEMTEWLEESPARHSVVDLDPTLPAIGALHPRWRVRMNIDGEELAAVATT